MVVLECEIVEEMCVELGDHEWFVYYVRKEKILESVMIGDPVIVLCGKVWVFGCDFNCFFVCLVCKEIYEGLRALEDDG